MSELRALLRSAVGWGTGSGGWDGEGGCGCFMPEGHGGFVVEVVVEEARGYRC